MPDQTNYSYQIFDDKKNYALTELHAQVLGGSDALAFNTTINELLSVDISTLIVDCKNVQLKI